MTDGFDVENSAAQASRLDRHQTSTTTLDPNQMPPGVIIAITLSILFGLVALVVSWKVNIFSIYLKS